MKTKLKLVAAAVALVVSGQAAAAVVDGSLFITVFDVVGQKSYARDLGVQIDAFAANPALLGTVDLSVDPLYAGFAGLTNAKWVLSGASQTGNKSALYSSNDPVFTGTQAQLSTLKNTIGAFIFTQGIALSTTTGSPLNSGIQNGPVGSTPAESGYAGAASWGDTLGGSIFTTSAMVGSQMDLNMITGIRPPGSRTAVYKVEKIGAYTLSSAGVLSASVAAPVPVPAAAWLLGSALIGMAGMARRRDDEIEGQAA